MDLCDCCKRKVSTMLYGINPSTALKNIMARKNERKRNLSRSKRNIKSALVVQGGAMRGVFSAGSLIALENLGFSHGFDAVYGSSGGAMNSAYFLSSQSAFGTSIYYQDINNSNFINPLRLNKMIDMDYLFDKVIRDEKPLNISKVIKSKSTFYFFVVEASGTTVRFNSRDEKLMELLKASCALPVYYQPVAFNGKIFLDGGLSKALPVEEAINDGCTDILVLLTQPVKSRDSISSFENLILKLAMPRLSKFVDVWLNSYINCFDLAIGRINKKNVNIVAIMPDSDFKLNRLTKDESLLKEAAIDGAKKVYQLFNKSFDTSNILRYN